MDRRAQSREAVRAASWLRCLTRLAALTLHLALVTFRYACQRSGGLADQPVEVRQYRELFLIVESIIRWSSAIWSVVWVNVFSRSGTECIGHYC